MDRRDNRYTLGLGLLGIGAIMLLARIGGGSGWLWLALVAIAFLIGYARERRYGFLVIGSVLAGIAIGQLLEGNWGWDNAFLISLGLGLAAIDRVEPRPNRWPIAVGGGLIALGVVAGVLSSGLLTTPLFAALLVAAGVVLLWRGRGRERWTERPRPAPPPTGDPQRAAGPAAAPPIADARAQASTEGAAAPVATAPDPRAARRDALERWRAVRAEAEGRTPGAVVPDTTLDNIAEADPRSLEALADVSGVGPVTLERYGEELLTALNATVR